MSEHNYQIIRRFGPSIFKIKIPKDIVDKLNSYVDNLVKDQEIIVNPGEYSIIIPDDTFKDINGNKVESYSVNINVDFIQPTIDNLDLINNLDLLQNINLFNKVSFIPYSISDLQIFVSSNNDLVSSINILDNEGNMQIVFDPNIKEI